MKNEPSASKAETGSGPYIVTCIPFFAHAVDTWPNVSVGSKDARN